MTRQVGDRAGQLLARGIGICLGGVLGLVGWAWIIEEPVILWLAVIPAVVGTALTFVGLIAWGVKIGRQA